MRSAVLILAAIPLYAAITQPVKVTGGSLAGAPGKDTTIAVFKGVPFAAPPVGDLRWRAPQAVVPWQGVIKADQFGISCIQSIVAERKPWTYEFMTHTEISEDCLFLNVWTGARTASEKRPVYVFIHGGGNTEGSGAGPVYDGEGLAEKGIVVVTVNYRLGIFGFFTHPDLTAESDAHASGNYALLDLIAALHRVHDNIAAFGGDPNRVTIGGQMPGPDAAQYGAFHTSEVPYAMNTLSMSGRPFTEDDRKISGTLSDYFANFIRTGDPNGKGLAHWPSTVEQPGTTMEVGDRDAVMPVAGDKDKLAFFESALTRPNPAAGPR